MQSAVQSQRIFEFCIWDCFPSLAKMADKQRLLTLRLPQRECSSKSPILPTCDPYELGLNRQLDNVGT